MTFADFSKHLSKIEATPKRLEITDLLVKLIKRAGSDEIEKTVNLSLGQLAPLYKDINFNIAEKMIIRAVAAATGEEEANIDIEFRKIGDLGETVMSLRSASWRSNNLTKDSHAPISSRLGMTINEVFEILLEIAQDSGGNSQERKIEKTSDLLRELDPLSAKYAVRIILGNLRLGFSDRTVLDALSNIVSGDKSARKKLEEIYNVRPDIGWMAKQIQNSEFRIQNFRTEPQLGIPILPALCQRLEGTDEIIEKMGTVAAEPKWDGQRIQAHAWIIRKKEKGKRKKEIKKTIFIKLFTRGLEDVSSMFPDLVNSLISLFNPSFFFLLPSSFIIDGEVVAFDHKTNKILPFQTMITRKRKYDIQQQLLNVPVRYMVFDIMYLNGKSLMQTPFSERRIILKNVIARSPVRWDDVAISRSDRHGLSGLAMTIVLAPQIITSDSIQIRGFLKKQIDSGLEGIVAKRLDSPYSPGRTGFSWVKLKWEGKAKSGGLVDTVDCVVMGIYAGQGKRAGFGAGAFLVGVLGYQSSVVSFRLPVNQFSVSQSKTDRPITEKPESENRKQKTDNVLFLTISKIGTGLSDDQWRELKVKSEKLKVKSCPKEYEVPKALTPDIWVAPKIVVEIQADNITASPLHTAGFALRFPRLVRYRDDKSPQQITTVGEVKELYKLQ